MSRLRNRNIRTKIHAVARWGQQLAGSGKSLANDGATTTADSGIGEARPTSSNPRGRRRRAEWRSDAERRVEASPNDSSDDESRRSFSSVDTLRVLEEIRNLEDSVMSASAESYNSWHEEYENDSTRLVRAEFERMERVLQREEAIPAHYDKDEYKLWIRTFPLLSLVARSSRPDASPPSSDAKNSTPRAADAIVDQLEACRALPSDGQPTTTYSSKHLAVNNTINPRTASISAAHSFLQLAPLHLARRQSFKPTTTAPSRRGASGRDSDWRKDARDAHKRFADNPRTQTFYSCAQAEKHSMQQRQLERRRKSSKTESLKSSSEFIVLPPIEGKELRSSSAATIANLGRASVLTLGRLRHPPVGPLYESSEHRDESDGFVSYRHRKRKY